MIVKRRAGSSKGAVAPRVHLPFMTLDAGWCAAGMPAVFAGETARLDEARSDLDDVEQELGPKAIGVIALEWAPKGVRGQSRLSIERCWRDVENPL
ncbi:MAG: hypothetical protein ACREEP_15350 [Dongiaceae bacterium]